MPPNYLYSIDAQDGRTVISARQRGLGPDGAVVDLGPLFLEVGEDNAALREAPAAFL